MNKPTMYKARFHMWSGESFDDCMGWLNKDEDKAKDTRMRILNDINHGKPFWTYSNIVFPDTLRRVEFFWDDGDD